MPVAARAPLDAAPLFAGYPWEGVGRLVDRARNVRDLRVHRLEVLGAARFRERGRPVPPELLDDVREAQLATLTASVLIRRVREVCDGPLLVFKGLEAAARYPLPALRPFGDVDVLVPDAEAVQAQLEAAGFGHVGPELEWGTLHHLARLAHPDLPFCVEVHRRPKWVDRLAVPSIDEIFADAVPSSSGVEGVVAPAPAVHAVLLAAHAWAERPLGCIGDLVDVVAVSAEADHGEVRRVASQFGLGRVWTATMNAADTLFLDDPARWQLRTWARHLSTARGQTVLESHLERVLAPFSALEPRGAVESAVGGLAGTVRPAAGETWREKLDRTLRAFRHAFVRRSDHERSLGKGGRAP
jgi:hypothetical protein